MLAMGSLVGLGAAMTFGTAIWIFASSRIDFSIRSIWDHAEWIALGTLLLGPILFFLMYKLGDVEPLFGVPFGAPWWKYVVFGAVTPIWTALTLGFQVGLFVVAPILTPAKVVYEYTLSPTASLTSAVIALPITFLCVTLAFAILYFITALHGKGAILKSDRVVLRGRPKVGKLWPLSEVFYFSASTMLKGGADGYEVIGWLRWMVLSQVLVAKLLELLIVGVGIGLIFLRLPGVVR